MTTLAKLKTRTDSGKQRKFIHETPISMMGAPDLTSTKINGVRYYITPHGVFPSVTTFLKYFDDGKWKEEWIAKVGEEAAAAESKRCTTRGTMVHKALEEYLLNQPNPEQHAGQYNRMYSQIRKVLARKVDKVFCLETALYSPTLKLAGRLDCAGLWNGVRSIIDFKNSNRMKKKDSIEDYFLQTSIYSIMLQQQFGVEAKQLVICNSVEKDTVMEAQIIIGQRETYMPKLAAMVKDFHANSGYYDNLPPLESLVPEFAKEEE